MCTVSREREKPYDDLVARRPLPPRAFDADAHVPATSGALPPFDATFERLVGKVGAKATPVQIAALHGDFERRTGAFGPTTRGTSRGAAPSGTTR